MPVISVKNGHKLRFQHYKQGFVVYRTNLYQQNNFFILLFYFPLDRSRIKMV
jgi:hypothetical protein